MKIILTGATGFVGEGILLACLVSQTEMTPKV
jgi:thioester reductase-like protein